MEPGPPTPRSAAPDLVPLAWLFDELRRSLETAVRSLQRYRREADAAAAEFHVPGLQHLLLASQQLHQAAGALQMVGESACATVAGAMEGLVQHFAEQSLPCTDIAVARIEETGLALTDYLQTQLLGRPAPSLALFPHYRDIRKLAGVERVDPAELWRPPTSLRTMPPPNAAPAEIHDAAVRNAFDHAVLQVMKSADPDAAHALHGQCLALAAGAPTPRLQTFWQLAAAYWQATALALVPADLHSKRMASRMRTQYAALARGDAEPTQELVHALLFFCARAEPPLGGGATLAGVRSAQELEGAPTFDDSERRFGRVHPQALATARKRIAVAVEAWAEAAGRDAHQRRPAYEQFAPLADALAPLHAGTRPLAEALAQATEAAWHAGALPPAPLALEVATALLYLECACADPERSHANLGERAAVLGERLLLAQEGATSAPLPDWMHALYRAVHERETTDSLVAALRQTLGEVEQALDQFFHAPREKAVLGKVVAQLGQIQGVLSMVGLAHAAQATRHLREAVAGHMADAADDAGTRIASFERLGRNVATLGWLVDMWGHQPALAQQQFVWDEAQTVLRRTDDAPPPPDAGPAAVASEMAPEPVEEEALEMPAGSIPEMVPEVAPEMEPDVQEPQAPPALQPPDGQELDDADQWSQRLQSELGTWALQQPQPPAPSSVALAKALSDGTRKLGFEDLAQLAGLLAQTLEQLRQYPAHAPLPTQPPLDAAEEIRRLLHQFAAGFMKPPRDTVVQALRALHDAPVPVNPAQLLAALRTRQQAQRERLGEALAQLDRWLDEHGPSLRAAGPLPASAEELHALRSHLQQTIAALDDDLAATAT